MIVCSHDDQIFHSEIRVSFFLIHNQIEINFPVNNRKNKRFRLLGMLHSIDKYFKLES